MATVKAATENREINIELVMAQRVRAPSSEKLVTSGKGPGFWTAAYDLRPLFGLRVLPDNPNGCAGPRQSPVSSRPPGLRTG